MGDISWAAMDCGCTIKVETCKRYDRCYGINLGTRVRSAQMLTPCATHGKLMDNST